MHDPINELLESEPSKATIWLDNWLKTGKRIELDDGVNWLGFAESAGAKAVSIAEREHPQASESLLWARVAIIVREHLASSRTEVDDPIELRLFDAMVVRFNMILLFGAHRGDFVCDVDQFVEWFYKSLCYTKQEAENLAGMWHEKPTERTYEFKVLIEQLRMLRTLAMQERLVADSTLLEWLSILDVIEPKTAGL